LSGKKNIQRASRKGEMQKMEMEETMAKERIGREHEIAGKSIE